MTLTTNFQLPAVREGHGPYPNQQLAKDGALR